MNLGPSTRSTRLITLFQQHSTLVLSGSTRIGLIELVSEKATFEMQILLSELPCTVTGFLVPGARHDMRHSGTPPHEIMFAMTRNHIPSDADRLLRNQSSTRYHAGLRPG